VRIMGIVAKYAAKVKILRFADKWIL